MITVIAGAALGLAGKNPVCRLITDASEQGAVNECFQQIDWMTIFFLPVGADATGDPGEDMTGQMGNPDPGQDKEAHVVRQIPQVAFPVLLCPPDEGIPWRGFPCRGAKEETSQGATMNITDQILEVFPYGAPVTQVMIL